MYIQIELKHFHNFADFDISFKKNLLYTVQKVL